MTKTMRDGIFNGTLQQVFVVTEWRGGHVYRTRPVGWVLCKTDAPCVLINGVLSSPSTKLMKQAYEGR